MWEIVALVIVLVLLLGYLEYQYEFVFQTSHVPTYTNVSVAVPVQEAPSTNANTPTYVGCYKDTVVRALPKKVGVRTWSQCSAAAKDEGATYFGMQWPEGHKNGLGECFLGWDGYDKYGVSTNCNIKNTDNISIGGVWANSVYKTN